MAYGTFRYARLRLRGKPGESRRYLGFGQSLLYQTWLTAKAADVPVFSITKRTEDGAIVKATLLGDEHIIDIIPPGYDKESEVTEQVADIGFAQRLEPLCPTGLHMQRHPRGLVPVENPDDPTGEPIDLLTTTLYSFGGLQRYEITFEDAPPFRELRRKLVREGYPYSENPGVVPNTWVVEGYAGPLLPDMDVPTVWYAGVSNLYINYGRNWGLREAQRRLACLTVEYVAPSGKRIAVAPGTVPCNQGDPLLEWGGSLAKSNQPKGWPATKIDPVTGAESTCWVLHDFPFSGDQFEVVTSLTEMGGAGVSATLPWDSANIFELMDVSKDGRKFLVMAVVASANADDLPNRTWVEGGSYTGSFRTIFEEGRGIINRPMRVLKGILEYTFSDDLSELTVEALKEADGEGAETKGGTMHSWESSEDDTSPTYNSPDDQLPSQVKRLEPYIRYKRMSTTAENTPGTYTEIYEIYPGKVLGGPDENTTIQDFDPGGDGYYIVGNLPAGASDVSRPTGAAGGPFLSLFVDTPGVSFQVTAEETCTQVLGAYYDDLGAVQYIEFEGDWTLTYTITPTVLSSGVLRYERKVEMVSDGQGGAVVNSIEHQVPTNTAVWEVQYDVEVHQIANCTHTHPQAVEAWTVESSGTPYKLEHRAKQWLTTYTANDLWGTYRKPAYRGAGATGPSAPTTFGWTTDANTLQMGLDGDAFLSAPHDGFVTVSGGIMDGTIIKTQLAEEFYGTKAPLPMGHWYVGNFGVGSLFYYFVGTRNLDKLRLSAEDGRSAGSDTGIYNMVPNRTFTARMGLTRYSSDQLLMVRGMNCWISYDFLVDGDQLDPDIVLVGQMELIGGAGVLEYYDAGYCGPRTNFVQAVKCDVLDAGINTLDGSTDYQYPRGESSEHRTAIRTPFGVRHAAWNDTPLIDPMAGGGWYSGWTTDPSSWPATMGRPFARQNNGSYNPITDQLTVECNHPNCWVGAYEPLEVMLIKYPEHPLLALLYVGESAIPGYEVVEEA